jgi:two-component system, cell cycle sensor histidine kinase and response regulator CckA
MCVRMRKFVFLLILATVMAGCSSSDFNDFTGQGEPVILTQPEQAWISEHPIILCAPDPNFPPAEFFNASGEYKGLVADYLELIFNRVGLEKKIIKLKGWSTVMDHARGKKIDLLTAAAKTSQRQVFLDFTEPFVELPAVIIARQQVSRELTLEKLTGMKVAVVREYAIHDYIVLNYPHLDLDLVPDIQTGLRKVSFGIVDAMVGNIAGVSYFIEKGTITNLKVAGETGFTYKLCFAPRKDWPVLTRILNKGLASLSSDEKREIYSKWIRLERSPIFSKKFLVSFGLFFGLFLLLIVVFIGWNRSLRSLVDEKTKELKKEVAKRDQAKLTLRESEEKLAGIINAINDHMVMLDEDLNILWANHTSREAFGDNFENKKCYEAFAGLDQPCENCIAQKCFKEGYMQEREINLKKGNNLRYDFWETTNAVSLDRKGLPKTIVTIFRDITQRKALAAEAMRAGHLASIGELAAGVAHEINNPINSIINLAQITLNEDRSNGQTNDIALRMINEGNRIAEIVSNLLAFAKDAKRVKMPLNLKDILDKTFALTETQIIKDGITLDVDLPSDLPNIFGHMQQIQQVFLNLINNSRFALNRKPFTKESVKTINIKASTEIIKERLYLKIIFEDNGSGISDKVIDRVMDPFFTTKTGGEGTGLGLSISHGIISDHKGRMKIESRESEFTRLIITLPAGEKS